MAVWKFSTEMSALHFIQRQNLLYVVMFSPTADYILCLSLAQDI